MVDGEGKGDCGEKIEEMNERDEMWEREGMERADEDIAELINSPQPNCYSSGLLFAHYATTRRLLFAPNPT